MASIPLHDAPRAAPRRTRSRGGDEPAGIAGARLLGFGSLAIPLSGAGLPLALFVIIAGFRASAAEVSSFGAGLDALERQPGGSIILSLTAIGLMAFGAFAFVEARYRRIRAPDDLNPLN